MVTLENIDIDKAILQNIDIDKILNRFKFGISNRATSDARLLCPPQRCALLVRALFLSIQSTFYTTLQNTAAGRVPVCTMAKRCPGPEDAGSSQ